MGRTLVIQLERLGDVVQSTPLISELSQGDGASDVDVLVLEPYVSVLQGCAGIKQAYGAGPARVRQLERVVKTAKLGEGPVPDAEDFLQRLALPEYERVVNLTHTKLGAWIAGAIPCQQRAGGAINGAGEWLYEGRSHIYSLAMMDFRPVNALNIVDIYRASLGRPLSTPRLGQFYVAKGEESGVPPAGGPRVLVNPGSSEPSRRWPAECFAKVSERLASAGVPIAVVGSEADIPMCSKVVQACPRRPPENYCGKLSIAEMTRLFSESALLISNDTGAVHLAAAVSLPVVGIYGGTSWYRETAAWGRKHLAVQGGLEPGKAGAEPAWPSPVVVLAAARQRIGLADSSELESAVLAERGVRVWETDWLPDGADPLGGLRYRSFTGNELSWDALTAEVFRHVIAAELCHQDLDVSAEFLSRRLQHEPCVVTADAPQQQTAWQVQAIAWLKQLDAAAARAAAAARLIGTNDQSKVERAQQYIAEVLRMVEQLAAAQGAPPTLAAVLRYLYWCLRNLPPDLNPKQVLQEHEALLVRTAEIISRVGYLSEVIALEAPWR